MTYHETLQPSVVWADSAVAQPKVPVAILEAILDYVKRALANDPRAAQAGIARLTAILDGRDATPKPPAFIRGGLAPWQTKRIATYLVEHLVEPIRITALARMVSLSVA